jgi:hypothetical protein
MRRGRFIITLIGAMAAVMLVAAGAAFAADSHQIYADVADGQLTGQYSSGELQAATKDATVEGYGGVTAQTMRPVVAHAAGQQKTISRCTGIDANGNKVIKTVPAGSAGSGTNAACVKGTQFTQSNTAPAGTLPFTGIQLGVFAALGIALLAGGLMLRRAARD